MTFIIFHKIWLKCIYIYIIICWSALNGFDIELVRKISDTKLRDKYAQILKSKLSEYLFSVKDTQCILKEQTL